MVLKRQKLDEILSEFPDQQQEEVISIAEFLLKGRSKCSENAPHTSVSSLFGIWDSGDTRSADNDRIDRDLTHRYANTHNNVAC